MFHVELRQSLHVTRAFNLSAEELWARIVSPWVTDQAIQLDDRRWLPERARLTIYEGPALRTEEIGLGRGWSNVTKSGDDVTARVLAEARQALDAQQRGIGDEPSVADCKQDILAHCASEPVGLAELVLLASERFPNRRVSARLALVEQSSGNCCTRGGRCCCEQARPQSRSAATNGRRSCSRGRRGRRIRRLRCSC